MNDNSEVGFIMIGGTEHMDEKRNWQSKIAGIFLILLGYFLGGNAPKTGYCYGDRIFEFLGLPAWSEGTTGTHYPGIIGIFIIIVGIGLISPRKKNMRIVMWIAVILLLLLISLR